MIVGIGTDIVEIARIDASIQRQGQRFAERILTASELHAMRACAKPSAYLAKRFAVKEAAAKAMGTGFAAGISWQHIAVDNNKFGAPQLVFTEAALARLHSLGVKAHHVSISDEQHYAVATVILES